MLRLSVVVAVTLISFVLNAQPVKVMLVTGGHAFDTIQFFDMFDALEGVEYEHFAQPKANRALVRGAAADFDVLVFYDMWGNISEPEKAAYLNLTQLGKPFLFLHHALASYQDWPEFEEILGGKYVEKGKNVPEALLSTYDHDVWVYSSVANIHPVTNGFRELRFFDEIYGNVSIADAVVPLLTTRHPKSMEVIAWENRYNNSKIIYLQPGHDKRTYTEPDYRKLLRQAIVYLAEQD